MILQNHGYKVTKFSQHGKIFRSDFKKIHPDSPSRRQHDVLDLVGCGEQRRNFLVGETGDATADARHEKSQILAALGKRDELVHVGPNRFHAALHRRNGVALPLQTDALPHHRAKLPVGDIRRSTAMHSPQIAAKNENLVRLQLRDKLRSRPLLFVRLFHIFLND